MLDITSSPVYFGERLRGSSFLLASEVGADLRHALTEAQAATFIEADILATLSALGRPQIDVLILRLSYDIEKPQLTGAMNALHFARQDGHARAIALDVREWRTKDVEFLLQSGIDAILVDSEDRFLIEAAGRRHITAISSVEGEQKKPAGSGASG